MTDTPKPAQGPEAVSNTSAERIAKVIARSGVASRRDAEKMILAGRVSVNGKKVDTPALDVLPTDKVTIDGKPIDAPQETRVWLYYKPLGLVTTEKDEQGRRTIFDEMPEGMPRVLNIGRLDLNSEGLLLLTNDGGLKRRLELPETGWLRKYRVRVNGRPNEATFDPLRRGITIEGEDFQPMEISLDRQQGANAWLTVGIREGKNREIRRAMTEVGLTVNRLIRVSYGPFRLNDMQPGTVVEVKRKLLRDQLGDRLFLGVEDGRPARAERMAPKPRGRRDEGEGESRAPRRGPPPARREGEEAPRKGFGRQRDFAEGNEGAPRKPRFGREGEESKRPFGKRPFDKADGEKRPYTPRPPREGEEGRSEGRFGERKGSFGKPRSFGAKSHRDESAEGKRPFTRRDEGEGRKPRAEGFGGKPREGFEGKKPYARRDGEGFEGRKPYTPREGGEDRKPRAPRGEGFEGKKPYARRDGEGFGGKKPYAPRGERSEGYDDRKPRAPRGEGFEGRKPYTPREGGRSEGYGDKKPYQRREGEGGKPGFKSAGFKSHGGKPGAKPRAEGFKSHGAKAGTSIKRPPRGEGKPGPKRG